MTARFWRRATFVLGLACIASVGVWQWAIGWNPSLEAMREATPYGRAVTVLTVLLWVAYDRYSAAARAGR